MPPVCAVRKGFQKLAYPDSQAACPSTKLFGGQLQTVLTPAFQQCARVQLISSTFPFSAGQPNVFGIESQSVHPLAVPSFRSVSIISSQDCA
jgi:hypothetical protein